VTGTIPDSTSKQSNKMPISTIYLMRHAEREDRAKEMNNEDWVYSVNEPKSIAL
jgi:hypothetical protein